MVMHTAHTIKRTLDKQKYLLAVIVIYAEIATMCTECTLLIITAESDPIYENHIETD